MKAPRIVSVLSLLFVIAMIVSGIACGPQKKFCVPGKVDPKTGVLGDKDGNCIEPGADAGTDTGSTIIGDDGGATFID
jgi:hypothetical protein